MQYSTKRIYFGDHPFIITENVYEPSEDSFLFAEILQATTDAHVLDVGTGCGILGILAAKKADEVIAVDLNPHAVRCAKENAVINHVNSKMAFIQGDLLTALSKSAKFDLIIFNAPYLPTVEGEEAFWIGRSWAGGVNGREVIDRFISQVSHHLKPAGRVLLMQSTLANVEATLRKFAQYNLKAIVRAERALPFFETLVLIQAEA